MRAFRVLVVDDSKFMRQIITDLIQKDSRFQVVGTAANGIEALQKVRELNPDLITMDVEMPEMNGLEALKRIMQDQPKPVIMLSGINEQGMKETILALESGAFDFIRKPSVVHDQDINNVAKELNKQLSAAIQAKERRALWEEEQKVKESGEPRTQSSRNATGTLPSMDAGPGIPGKDRQDKAQSEQGRGAGSLKDIESKPKGQAVRKPPEARQAAERHESTNAGRDHFKRSKPKPTQQADPAAAPETTRKERGHQSRPGEPVLERGAGSQHKAHQTSPALEHIVAVGCSTGGPRALRTLLERLPANFPAPVVIVQHMPPNFTKSLAARLNTFSPLHVQEAEQGMVLKQGCAYVAPGGHHIRIVESAGGEWIIRVSQEEQVNGHRPSVDVLFESLLPFQHIKRHAVLMTGMGSDGAKAMKMLYDSGVSSTIAESEETCVVYGMPRSAVELGCVSHVLPLHSIPDKLIQAVKNGK
ncbi:protein-glutamate methylesterase/protein-glutamine glutaminase [Paenibacillus algicola]|uniref:protein-glutamate methylesterase/protein-glutamine glutaminase n=1 Tax=Paenibacillus algicola TaxID=2565926 RepID=UPI0010FEE33C|nr:chemotaxis response regulator protein-glutamate methylesterase [Paenibacillus algicola]